MKKYSAVLFIIMLTICFSCKKEKIETYSSNNYVAFVKEIKDTTFMSFFFFVEKDEIEYPLEVKLIGNILTKDTEFHIAVDEAKTTLNKSLYTIPEKFIFSAGQIIDTMYIKLKNDPDLEKNRYRLQLRITDGTELFSANSPYTTMVMFVSNQAEKPDWWTLNYDTEGNRVNNSVERIYLGPYSRRKYEAFIKATGFTDIGKTDGERRIRCVTFLHYLNAQNPKLEEEDGTFITIPIIG